jgi:hypothetical protein
MKKVFFLLFALLVISCENKVKISALDYKMVNDMPIITLDGKPFDGVAWSEDGESSSITVKRGVFTKLEFYDTDGVMYWKSGLSGESFYDKDGKKISEKRFSKQYPDTYEKWLEDYLSSDFDKLFEGYIDDDDTEETDSIEE